MIDPNRQWFFCQRCDQVVIRCDVCGNTSCNGGGCDACHADFEEVHRMFEAGTAPSPAGLPVIGAIGGATPWERPGMNGERST